MLPLNRNKMFVKNECMDNDCEQRRKKDFTSIQIRREIQ